MKYLRLMSLFLVIVLLAVLSSCSDGKGKDNKVRYTSATVSAGFGAAAGSQAASFAGTVADVASMTVDVKNGDTFIAQGVALSNSNGTWSATVADLPVGPQLTFIGHAYDGSASEIFTGTTTQALSDLTLQIVPGGNNVVIVMAPVSAGDTLAFPRITQITRPAEIRSGSTVTFSVSVQGNSGETLAFAVTPGNGGGSFSPAAETVALNGTTATFVLLYYAPASAGTYTHSIKVTNSQGNSVETGFATTIVDQLSDTTVTIQFNPVITGIDAVRSGSEVTFTAKVSDDGPAGELRYLWSIDNGLTFADAAVNPAVLQGYTEAAAGVLTLTVTDGNGSGGSTTLHYSIAQGQFPDTVVVDTPVTDPTGTTPDPSAPVTLISGLSSPVGLAADASNIYWAETNKMIRKMDLSSGATTTLVGGMGSSIVFGIDASYAYYHSTANCRMDKVSLNGGMTSSVISSVGTVGDILIDPTNAYWTEVGSGGRVSKVNLSTGAETLLASGLNNPTHLAANSTSVFWTASTATTGAIQKISISGGLASTIASGLMMPFDLVVDASNVYWTEQGSGAIKTVMTGGGTVTTLATGLNSPTYLAINGSYLYWTDSGTKTLKKMLKSGGEIITLSTETAAITGIATNATNVIWEIGGASGAIKKLPL